MKIPDTLEHEKNKYLLIKIMEESAEVAQAAAKALTFGINNHNPADTSGTNNGIDIMTEFYQLDAIIEMLQEANVLPRFTQHKELEIKIEKKDKVRKYMKKYGVN